MNIKTTLSRYLGRLYFFNFLALFGALLAIIYLFDTIELIRRAGNIDGIPLSLVFQMGLLKLPEVGQVLFPFAILFSAMFTFWQLTRRQELVVVRASGLSVWQFLTPVIAVAMAIGVLQMGVINPAGALLVGKFEQLERKYLDRSTNQIAIFQEGLWLRQSYEDVEGGYVILHAHRIDPPWTLKNVTTLYFGEDDTFLKRVQAKSAVLEPERWVMNEATIYGEQRAINSGGVNSANKNNPKNAKQDNTRARLILPTRLTIKDVEDSFASPESMSFWALPGHIRTLEDTGFDASRLKVHYQSLMARPLLFAAMVLLAASVSMRPPRAGGGFIFLAFGVFSGFIVFFLSSFLEALGASSQIPVFLAAWSPAIICLLLGLSITMNLEDG